MSTATAGAPALNILHQKKLNISEAAKALCMSRTTFNKHRDKGDLPEPISMANRLYWLERDLERWIIDQNPHLQHREHLANSAKKALEKAKAMKLQAVS